MAYDRIYGKGMGCYLLCPIDPILHWPLDIEYVGLIAVVVVCAEGVESVIAVAMYAEEITDPTWVGWIPVYTYAGERMAGVEGSGYTWALGPAGWTGLLPGSFARFPRTEQD
jgi:hypothetical protein